MKILFHAMIFDFYWYFIIILLWCISVVMETFAKTAAFLEKADDTLHDISQQVSHGSDVVPRQYISVLKDCLSRIKVLKV